MTDEGLRVAIVTGAAGGVGRVLVSTLLESGYRVIGIDQAPPAPELADQIIGLVGDVSLTSCAELGVRTALQQHGRLDLVINNAALYFRRSVAETSDQDWDRVMAVNVRGVFVQCRAALPSLADTKGAIVNVASTAGLVGKAGQVLYGTSKGAVIQMTRQLAVETAPLGVRVNAVAAGPIDTQFAASSWHEGEAKARAQSVAAIPLGRISTAGEVAQAVMFLASAQASGITGAILSVDGGMVAQ